MHKTTRRNRTPVPCTPSPTPRSVGFSLKVSESLRYNSDNFLRIPTLSKSVFSRPLLNQEDSTYWKATLNRNRMSFLTGSWPSYPTSSRRHRSPKRPGERTSTAPPFTNG